MLFITSLFCVRHIHASMEKAGEVRGWKAAVCRPFKITLWTVLVRNCWNGHERILTFPPMTYPSFNFPRWKKNSPTLLKKTRDVFQAHLYRFYWQFPMFPFALFETFSVILPRNVPDRTEWLFLSIGWIHHKSSTTFIVAIVLTVSSKPGSHHGFARWESALRSNQFKCFVWPHSTFQKSTTALMGGHFNSVGNWKLQ